MTMSCPIAYWMQQSPNKCAIRSLAYVYTYADLHELICQICGFLTQTPKTPLAFPAEISPNAIALLFASFRMGRCIFPFHPKLPEDVKKIFKATYIDLDKITLHSSLQNPQLSSNTIATAIATSGTSGKPKIALHTIDNHYISAQTAVSALNLEYSDSYLFNLPLYHVSGIAVCFRTFMAGATLLMPDSAAEATHISLVPTQLYRMLEQKTVYPHIKCLLIGGAPLSFSLYERALAQQLPIYLSYGMTETSSMIALKKPDKSSLIAGQPLPHVEIKIAEDREIHVRGAAVFYGYFGEDPIDRKAWFPTKDLGSWNSQGQLEILGRKDRQFISGGENIQPEEIEQALLSHPEILQAFIEPIQDQEYGFRPKAHVFCKKSIYEKEIQQHLEKLLLPFKIPKVFVFHSTPLERQKTLQ